MHITDTFLKTKGSPKHRYVAFFSLPGKAKYTGKSIMVNVTDVFSNIAISGTPLSKDNCF